MHVLVSMFLFASMPMHLVPNEYLAICLTTFLWLKLGVLKNLAHYCIAIFACGLSVPTK